MAEADVLCDPGYKRLRGPLFHEPTPSFVIGEHVFRFFRGSYQKILGEIAPGSSLLTSSDLDSTVLRSALLQHQGLDVWSFIHSYTERGWASAVRPTFSGFVCHQRSIHGESPFCGAWVVTHTQK